jgi:hypothetical protein
LLAGQQNAPELPVATTHRVTFELSSEQLAHFEALVEKIPKLGAPQECDKLRCDARIATSDGPNKSTTSSPAAWAGPTRKRTSSPCAAPAISWPTARGLSAAGAGIAQKLSRQNSPGGFNWGQPIPASSPSERPAFGDSIPPGVGPARSAASARGLSGMG